MSEVVNVSVDEALERLAIDPEYDPGDGPGPCVHTFLDAGFGLLGAHWKVEEVKALMEQNGVEESGEMASATGHGLVTFRGSEGRRPLFLATREDDDG